MRSWPWLLALLLAAAGLWVAWRRYGRLWLAYRIRRRVITMAPDSSGDAIQFYLSAIDELLKLAGLHCPPGHTIEKYLAHLGSVGAADGDPEMAAAFNRIFYNLESGEQDAARAYGRLFERLYDLDLLRAGAATGQRPLP